MIFHLTQNFSKKNFSIQWKVDTLAIQPWGRFLSSSSFNESEYSSSTLITSKAFDWLVVSVSEPPEPSCDWLSCSISSASSFVSPSDPRRIIFKFSPPDQLHLKSIFVSTNASPPILRKCEGYKYQSFDLSDAIKNSKISKMSFLRMQAGSTNIGGRTCVLRLWFDINFFEEKCLEI